MVVDSFKGISRNGNAYLKAVIRDEVGEYSVMLMDRSCRNEFGQWSRVKVLSNFYEKNEKGLAKDSIVVFYGSKGDDILFAQGFEVINEKIYMKLSEIPTS